MITGYDVLHTTGPGTIGGDVHAVDRPTLARIARWIVDAGRVVALTGAGVSTGSGIPDFRGPNGVWTREPEAERLSTYQNYVADPEVRREVWKRRLENPSFTAEPNSSHHALVELERSGHLHTVITQNIDGLHQKAGSDTGRVVEVHGTIHEVVCLSCDRRRPTPEVLAQVRDGDPDPRCAHCGGLQKSATISFGQSLDPAVLQRAHDAAIGSDVFLALGSSLVVHPVALLPRTALEAGARLIVVNQGNTPYDERADVVLRDDVGEVLEALAREVGSLRRSRGTNT